MQAGQLQVPCMKHTTCWSVSEGSSLAFYRLTPSSLLIGPGSERPGDERRTGKLVAFWSLWPCGASFSLVVPLSGTLSNKLQAQELPEPEIAS
jgi:hypothetical protein